MKPIAFRIYDVQARSYYQILHQVDNRVDAHSRVQILAPVDYQILERVWHSALYPLGLGESLNEGT